AADVAYGEKRAFDAARRRREHGLVDQQVIPDEQVVLHRAGRNLERLDDPGAHEQRQDHGDDDRLGGLPNGGLLEGGGHSGVTRRFLSALLSARGAHPHALLRASRDGLRPVRGTNRRGLAFLVELTILFPPLRPPETPPAGSPRVPRVSSAAFLPSAS